MAENSKTEWCDHTASPWCGCTKVSAGVPENLLNERGPEALRAQLEGKRSGQVMLGRHCPAWKSLRVQLPPSPINNTTPKERSCYL